MRKSLIYSILSVILVLLTAFAAGADDRQEPVDIIVALDKSLSMEEELGAVKEYVNTKIVDGLLQNGDFFLVISFFGKAPIVISDFIKGEEHKIEIKAKINSLKADGDWTDIGNSLDVLKTEVEKRSNDNRKKTLLLITDGKNEPPPTSRYYSKDGSFSHEYLQTTSETQKEGWKIIVLGLGTTSAKELAEQLKADYIETPDKVTSEDLAKILPDLAGTLKIKGEAGLTPVGQDNKSLLTLLVETDLFTEPPQIVISRISLEADSFSQDNLLRDAFRSTLPKTGEEELNIPLVFKSGLNPGIHKGTLYFTFSSSEHFETQIPVTFQINSFLQNYYWLSAPAVLLLALIVFLLVKVVGGKQIVFQLLVQERPLPKGKDTFAAKRGGDLYLKEGMDQFGISDKKTTRNIAQLAATEKGISMTLLKEDRFPGLKSSEKNILDKDYIIRTESGKDFHVRFNSLS